MVGNRYPDPADQDPIDEIHIDRRMFDTALSMGIRALGFAVSISSRLLSDRREVIEADHIVLPSESDTIH